MDITRHILEYYAGYAAVLLTVITLAILVYYWHKL